MMPAWGDKLVGAHAENWFADGPFIINSDNGRAYSRWLANRYKQQPNIIWVLGGDKLPVGFEATWQAMAAGLQEGDGGAHLISFYPRGDHSSSEWFHAERWLNFNMLMSNHKRRDLDNGAMIARDYALEPPKPCMDASPRYEDHPIGWKTANGYFDDNDVRQAAYWAVFAGAAGHTYGANPVWQMMAPGRRGISSPRRSWYEALDLPGAWNMLVLRRLMESRPLLGAEASSLIRVPAWRWVCDGLPLQWPAGHLGIAAAFRQEGARLVVRSKNRAEHRRGRILHQPGANIYTRRFA
jgi:hypothetical protein